MRKVYIAGGLRTPIGKTNGVFRILPPEDLLSPVLENIVKKYNIELADLDEVIIGNSVGVGGNIARLSSLKAFEDYSIPATSIDFQCGSGLKTIEIAYKQIKSGLDNLILAGGVDSTSLEADVFLKETDPRYSLYPSPLKRAPFSPIDLGDPDMLEGAENSAELLDVDRKTLDDLAYLSHKRAIKAKEDNFFQGIIQKIDNGKEIITEDENIRKRISRRLLDRMPSLVKEDGLITAGNACFTHDGAAALLLLSEEMKDKYQLKVKGEILDLVSVGLNPNYSPLGALKASQTILERNGLSQDDIKYFEVNEAFSVKNYSFLKALNLPLEKINPQGGALAYGHPYAASGTIIALHLLEELKEGELGIACLGVAGGLGIALLVRKVS